MANEFDEFNETMQGMIAGLSPQTRARAIKKIGKSIKKSNQENIAKQIEPSGAAFTPRAKPKLWQPEKIAKFLYPSNGSGKPRLVQLSNWTLIGDTITGQDEKSGGKVRSFKKSKIVRWLPSSAPASKIASVIETRALGKTIKSKMFQKLRSNRFFKEKYETDSAEIGFFGSAGRIASQHHFGETSEIKLRAKSKSVRYPRRELLGINHSNEEDAIIAVSEMLDF